MNTLPLQTSGPNAAEYRRTTGTSYVGMFKAAKEAALEIDGTPADSDPRDGFVTMSTQGVFGTDVQAYVSLWGEAGKESASVRYVSGTYVEEAPSEGRDHSLGTQKDRYIEFSENQERGLIKVEDRLSQTLTNLDSDSALVDDHKERNLVVKMDTGTVLSDNPRDNFLVFESGWSVAEFQKRRADLDG